MLVWMNEFKEFPAYYCICLGAEMGVQNRIDVEELELCREQRPVWKSVSQHAK
jgi:hypothetical protein